MIGNSILLINLGKIHTIYFVIERLIIPKTPFIGVLISWETVARNCKKRKTQLQDNLKKIYIRNKFTRRWEKKMRNVELMML